MQHVAWPKSHDLFSTGKSGCSGTQRTVFALFMGSGGNSGSLLLLVQKWRRYRQKQIYDAGLKIRRIFGNAFRIACAGTLSVTLCLLIIVIWRVLGVSALCWPPATRILRMKPSTLIRYGCSEIILLFFFFYLREFVRGLDNVKITKFAAAACVSDFTRYRWRTTRFCQHVFLDAAESGWTQESILRHYNKIFPIEISGYYVCLDLSIRINWYRCVS